MNEFSENFTVVLDANVLFGSKSRDLILSLADEELFRPRWSDLILEETKTALLNRKIKNININYLFSEMARAFPEANISNYEVELENYRLSLPDPNDNHVLAAAIVAKASVIVTNNLKDFPNNYLAKFGVESKSADEFISDAIFLSNPKSISALRKMKNRRKISVCRMIQEINKAGLTQTELVLQDLKNDI